MKNFEKGSVTIRTIAEMANVSHTTVSRALNGSELVKPLPAKRLRRLPNKSATFPI
ncbi:LacI family DNA-binding transcriptional regulator [Lentilactobacillus rapi]|uniref:LacI family DNA-binding transcriptional regulator n=1 Tax=Lentilactobacillus rapi TaxID=481723 RepID=UPI0030ED9B81